MQEMHIQKSYLTLMALCLLAMISSAVSWIPSLPSLPSFVEDLNWVTGRDCSKRLFGSTTTPEGWTRSEFWDRASGGCGLRFESCDGVAGWSSKSEDGSGWSSTKLVLEDNAALVIGLFVSKVLKATIWNIQVQPVSLATRISSDQRIFRQGMIWVNFWQIQAKFSEHCRLWN